MNQIIRGNRYVLTFGVAALLTMATGITACDVLNTNNEKGLGQMNIHMSSIDEQAGKVVANPEDSGIDTSGEVTGNHQNPMDGLEEVNIDVQELRVLYAETRPDTVTQDGEVVIDTVTTDAIWIELEITPGQINLMDLTDAGMLLGETDVPEGYYGQLRLVLGGNNEVVVNGETHSLRVPSGQQSGYKVQYEGRLHSGEIMDLTLAFDAERSVHVTGNGQFMLRPVMKLR